LDEAVFRGYGKLAIPRLVAKVAMPTLNDASLQQALSLLKGDLSSETFKAEALVADIVRTCTEGMSSRWLKPVHRALAADIMGRCAVTLPGRREMKQRDTVPVLLGMLQVDVQRAEEMDRRAATAARVAATSALRKFTNFPDGVSHVLDCQPNMTVLVQRLLDPSKKVVLAAASLLAHLVPAAGGEQAALCAGIVGHLLKLVDASRDGHDVQSRKQLVLALGIVAVLSHDENGNEMCVRENCVEVVADTAQAVVARGWQDVECKASAALMSLAISESGKYAVAECREAIVVLCALAARGNEDTRTNACMAIRLAAEQPLSESRFVGCLVGDVALLTAVFGKTALQSLVTLLESANEDTQVQAITAVLALTRDDDGCKEALQCLHLLDKVVEFVCKPEMPVGQETAIKVVKQLLACDATAAITTRFLKRVVEGMPPSHRSAQILARTPGIGDVIVEL
jgi:hypothetical protein